MTEFKKLEMLTMKDNYRYTFRNLCLEESGFALRYGQTTMFLSTCGRNDEEVPESLVSFLKYIGLSLQESTKDSDDGYVRQLQGLSRSLFSGSLTRSIYDRRSIGMLNMSGEGLHIRKSGGCGSSAGTLQMR